jgi:crotonobetainyl-CoA:carnitine CoA-transferase CaiB-like acyl-CoA transferase
MRLLQDIRVLDLGGFITGPYTAALLADFGADVVKVERPGGGDPFRALRDDLYSPQFQAHNQNKRSLTLDFTRPEGLESVAFDSANRRCLYNQQPPARGG